MVIYMKMSASKFKAECLKLMEGQEEVTITKFGKKKAKLVPFQPALGEVFGCGKGTVKYLGDIVESTGEVWDAEQ